MDQGKRILFILNPKAGKGKAKEAKRIIEKELDRFENPVEFKFTSKKGEAKKFAEQGSLEGSDIVVAVGGDGTVNEVATGLMNSNCNLGIIPIGSGNGLARHYKIPFIIQDAIKVILKNHTVSHDAVRINNKFSFNVSGVGFDAHIAHLFDKGSTRGLSGYVKFAINEYFKYDPVPVNIYLTGENEPITVSPLFISIATTSQFGNNAYIAPLADTSDGRFDITIVNKLSLIDALPFIWKLFRKKLKPSKDIQMIRTQSCRIGSEKLLPFHIDGESAGYYDQFQIDTLPGAVNIIVP